MTRAHAWIDSEHGLRVKVISEPESCAARQRRCSGPRRGFAGLKARFSKLKATLVKAVVNDTLDLRFSLDAPQHVLNSVKDVSMRDSRLNHHDAVPNEIQHLFRNVVRIKFSFIPEESPRPMLNATKNCISY